ncbi:hypothetical protein DL93DRAFT_1104614 [Clavulina sp. PMI_390]|nr:hypothetical protein DL93DRAFT_1104614 [Clavulina sp. PMI_390]
MPVTVSANCRTTAYDARKPSALRSDGWSCLFCIGGGVEATDLHLLAFKLLYGFTMFLGGVLTTLWLEKCSSTSRCARAADVLSLHNPPSDEIRRGGQLDGLV